MDTASSSASPGQKHQSGVKLPSPRTGKGFPPTGTNASDPVAPAWAGGSKGGEGIEAKITFGNLGTSPPVSSNADPSSCAKPMTKGGGRGERAGSTVQEAITAVVAMRVGAVKWGGARMEAKREFLGPRTQGAVCCCRSVETLVNRHNPGSYQKGYVWQKREKH